MSQIRLRPAQAAKSSASWVAALGKMAKHEASGETESPPFGFIRLGEQIGRLIDSIERTIDLES